MAAATAKLSVAQRQLAQADVIYFAAAPTTGTFFDELTANMLSAPTSMRYMAQARAIFGPGQYAEAHGVAGAGAAPPASLTQLLLQMPYTVGEAMRDIQNANQVTQAVIICQFLVDTADPIGMSSLIHMGGGISQIPFPPPPSPRPSQCVTPPFIQPERACSCRPATSNRISLSRQPR